LKNKCSKAAAYEGQCFYTNAARHICIKIPKPKNAGLMLPNGMQLKAPKNKKLILPQKRKKDNGMQLKAPKNKKLILPQKRKKDNG
jgi:hypothetical protein